MATIDPTGARHRDFDIPVILPRVAFRVLPPAAPDAPPPVTTVTCAVPEAAGPAASTGVTAPAASTGVTAPVVRLGLPVKGQRRAASLRRSGLAFTVSSDKPTADVEVRLVQLLSKGRKRPLGAKLMIEPGKTSVKVVVEPSRFAVRKLALPSTGRAVRAVAVVTALDGSVGQVTADFTLSG